MTTQEMRKQKLKPGYIWWNYGPFNGPANWKMRKIDDSLKSFQIYPPSKK